MSGGETCVAGRLCGLWISDRSGWAVGVLAGSDAGASDDPVADAMAFFSRIGPAAAALHELAGPERDRVKARIREWLEAHRSGGTVAFPAGAWFVSARHG